MGSFLFRDICIEYYEETATQINFLNLKGEIVMLMETSENVAKDAKEFKKVLLAQISVEDIDNDEFVAIKAFCKFTDDALKLIIEQAKQLKTLEEKLDELYGLLLAKTES